MNSLFPETPLLIYPSLAATIGLEAATLLGVLDELARYRRGQVDNSKQSRQWFQVGTDEFHARLPFWSPQDIQRISQRLRDLDLILLRSAPFAQVHQLDFAFNHQNAAPIANDYPVSQPSNHNQSVSQTSGISTRPIASRRFSTSTMASDWQPDTETLAGLAQLNIPEYFAREQVPEFVRYWRESGESQRSWGSKFIQYVKRQWAFHATHMARKSQAMLLPKDWQPSAELQTQIAQEGIPATFGKKVLNKFRLFHQSSGISHVNWDIPFFSWVKEEWQKQDTPFIETRKSIPMHSQWKPDSHTLDYLYVSYGIDKGFIEETIPEFIHKWIEKKAVYSEWGRIFAEHVIEQWRFVQLGISQNRERKSIEKSWQPSADCREILQTQLNIDAEFIQQQVPEFVLYWRNRADARYSWDNIFLRHIKQRWASSLQNIGKDDERQQIHTGSTRSKDLSIAQQLKDTSWAS
ncbi:MAG: hypothetical protein ACI82Z_000340 [Cellvibrionaceae bacterium]|jgi:hypothetical protein